MFGHMQGNVHGVYKVGNVTLQPELLGKHQAYCKAKLKTDDPRPLYLVFHGGSGSSKKEIATALENGVVKVRMFAMERIALLSFDKLS